MSDNAKRILKNLSLLLATIMLISVFLESGFRFLAYLGDRHVFSEAMKKKVEIPKNGEVDLGHIVYPSENHRVAYYLKQGISVNFVGVPVHTNSDGFRDKEYAIEKPPDTVRIIGIGDSVMFGYGVEEGKDYLSRLEDKLNKFGLPEKFEVINMGVPGYNTVAEVELFKEKGLKYKPDIVILGFVGNDLELADFMRKKEDYFTLDKSFFIEWVENRLKNTKRYTFEHKPPDEYALDLSRIPEEYWDCVGWSPLVNSLKELKRLSAENNFKVVVFIFTTGDMLRDNIIATSLAFGFIVTDVQEYYRDFVITSGVGLDKLHISPTDGHPSAFSHGVIAERLLENIIANRTRLGF